MRVYTFKELDDIITSHGWVQQRQRGSHVTYCKKGVSYIISIPRRTLKSEICSPMVRRLLKEAGIQQ